MIHAGLEGLTNCILFISHRSYHVRLEVPSTDKKMAASVSRATVRSKPAKTPLDSSKKSAMAYVVMVAPPNAKGAKTKLQAQGWLDKRYRMTKSSSSQIAVPITANAWHELRKELAIAEGPWHGVILDQGQQEMPLSTAQFAAKGKW